MEDCKKMMRWYMVLVALQTPKCERDAVQRVGQKSKVEQHNCLAQGELKVEGDIQVWLCHD
jgi:hypothetical protein